MPIKIPKGLPAEDTLISENIFIMREDIAVKQDIRPLKILLVNLMPTKIETETQFARLLGNTPLQVEMELLTMKSYTSTHVSQEHMLAFYKTFDEIKDCHFDGMIVTGAPVEMMEFEEVEYWKELTGIFEWSKTHVTSTLHICWAAQAGLYYHYGIKKYLLDEKMFGVYPHRVVHKGSILFRGFDDVFMVPHSRHTEIREEDVLKVPELKILAVSDEAGIYAISNDGGRQIFLTGHAEYDQYTLNKEYVRDKNKGLPIKPPKNYFPGDDDTKPPIVSWRSSASMLISNWLNYFIYQSTPYDLQMAGTSGDSKME